jgi:NAD(P) transhydrogenase subunit alpha
MVDVLVLVVVFAGSLAIGYLLISRVPALLHTPLMSMTNAISAITLLGVLLLFATRSSVLEQVFLAFALILAAFNVVGGFAITDRMLRMFRLHKPRAAVSPENGPRAS